jgi:hypothetical protein
MPGGLSLPKGWGFQGKPVLIFAIEAKLHALVERLIEKGAHAEGYTVIWPLFLACKQTLEIGRLRFGIEGAWGHGTDRLWIQGSDPRDYDFGKKLPNVIMRKGRQGWNDVVDFLRELSAGAESNDVVRLDIVGNERAGKTSFTRALKSEKGKTERINFDNRTVGIQQEEMQLGNLRVRMWDLAGQEVYRGLHAAFMTKR